jgi:hypothetical protein
MAVDRGVTVTFEIALPSDEKTQVVTGTAPSVNAAVEDAKTRLGSELYFGSMGMVLLGDGSPFGETIRWLRDVSGVRETTYLASTRGTAGDFFLQAGGVNGFTLRDILDASETVKPVELYRLRALLPVFDLGEDGHAALVGG